MIYTIYLGPSNCGCPVCKSDNLRFFLNEHNLRDTQDHILFTKPPAIFIHTESLRFGHADLAFIDFANHRGIPTVLCLPDNLLGQIESCRTILNSCISGVSLLTPDASKIDHVAELWESFICRIHASRNIPTLEIMIPLTPGNIGHIEKYLNLPYPEIVPQASITTTLFANWDPSLPSSIPSPATIKKNAPLWYAASRRAHTGLAFFDVPLCLLAPDLMHLARPNANRARVSFPSSCLRCVLNPICPGFHDNAATTPITSFSEIPRFSRPPILAALNHASDSTINISSPIAAARTSSDGNSLTSIQILEILTPPATGHATAVSLSATDLSASEATTASKIAGWLGLSMLWRTGYGQSFTTPQSPNCSTAVELPLSQADTLPQIVKSFPDTRIIIVNDTPGAPLARPIAHLESLMETLHGSGCRIPPIHVEGIPLCLFTSHQHLFTPQSGKVNSSPLICSSCGFSSICPGPSHDYVLQNGTSGIRPNSKSAQSEIVFTFSRKLTAAGQHCPFTDSPALAPEKTFVIQNDGSFDLYETDASPSDCLAIAAKNFSEHIYAADRSATYSLSAKCRDCTRLFECSGVFTPLSAAPSPPLPTITEGPVLCITRDGVPPGFHPAGASSLSIRNFSPARITQYATAIFHDCSDMIPSPLEFMQQLSESACPATRFLFTGRERMIIAGTPAVISDIPCIMPSAVADSARAAGLATVDHFRFVQSDVNFWCVVFEKPVIPTHPATREMLASFFLIRTCVANCVMCNIQNFFVNSSMKLQNALSVLDQLRLNGYEYVDLFGGEVTLRDDLDFIVAYASAIGLKPMIITTGHNLEADRLRRLACSGLVKCSVSLDAPNAFLHDAIKGARGLFSRATKAIAILGTTSYVDADVNMVLLPDNYVLAAETLRIAGDSGIRTARFFFCLSSPATSPVPRTLTTAQLRDFLDNILPEMERYAAKKNIALDIRPELPPRSDMDEWNARIADGRYNPVYGDESLICSAPDVRLLVDLDGNVYPCEVPLLFASCHTVGNIFEHNLMSIINSRAMYDFKQIAGHTPECRMCFGAMPSRKDPLA